MTTKTTTTTTMTIGDGQTTSKTESLPTRQTPTTSGLHVRHAGVNSGYETVNFKQRTTEDVAIKRVEVIRTYSVGTPESTKKQQQNTSPQEMELTYPKSTKIKSEEEKLYAVPAPINHYQTPTNNSLITTHDNVEPYQVSNVNRAFLGDSDLDEVKKQEIKLDSLLGDLDHGYGLIKEQRKAMQQEDEKASDIDIDGNKRESLHETIPVAIYAEREGKIYYPGHVVEIAGDKTPEKPHA